MVGERFMSMDSADVRKRVSKVFDEMYVQFGVTDRDLEQVEIALAEGSDFPDVVGSYGQESDFRSE